MNIYNQVHLSSISKELHEKGKKHAKKIRKESSNPNAKLSFGELLQKLLVEELKTGKLLKKLNK